MGKMEKPLMYSIFTVIGVITLFSYMFVYANTNTDYDLNTLEVECLFESEQEIMKNYYMSVETEDIPNEVSEENLDMTENIIDNTEDMTIESISTIKFIEYEEEYRTNNRLATVAVISEVSEQGYAWPVPNYSKVSSPYGWRICPFHGKEFHSGIDIPAPEGKPVIAAKSGVVLTSQYSKSYGNYVVIEHIDGGRTLYAHLIKRDVSVGQNVEQQEIIGWIGSTGSSTGNHLHYEIWKGNDTSSRVDPLSCY